jgi:hypothetical protein
MIALGNNCELIGLMTYGMDEIQKSRCANTFKKGTP